MFSIGYILAYALAARFLFFPPTVICCNQLYLSGKLTNKLEMGNMCIYDVKLSHQLIHTKQTHSFNEACI